MELHFKSFQKFDKLSVLQFSTDHVDQIDYIDGASAQDKAQVEISEVDGHGEVNSLKLVNLSESFVFFMDGDILVGAKQNRIINSSIIVAPKTTCIIPVSCVESGRWNYKSKHDSNFKVSHHEAPTSLRKNKANSVNDNLKSEGCYSSNQSKVWNEVSFILNSRNFKSGTSDLHEIFDKREKEYSENLAKFTLDNEANAVCFFINNTIINIEVFGRKSIYENYFRKLVGSAWFESENFELGANITEVEAKYKLLEFIDVYGNQQFEEHNGAVNGIEKRFDNKKFNGFELSLDCHLIHAAIFNKDTKSV